MNELARSYVVPLAEALFPSLLLDEAGRLRYQHSFIVRYKEGEDLDLRTHMDDSIITLNACLGEWAAGYTSWFSGFSLTGG
jgi:hypothetical protein